MVNDLLLKATAWTLVHSVWQGLVAALLAGMIILTTRKSTAALRYRLLAVLFVAFLGAAGLTFVYEFGNGENGAAASLKLPMLKSESNGLVNIDASDAVNSLADFLNAHSTAIVMIWFLFFAIKFLGIFNGFVQVYRIRNYRNFPVSDYWNRRIEALAASIQLNKTVLLLESAIVKVPSVTGFLKPMVLVPIGLLAHLPHDQAEAILLHELAHIKRKDYLVNLLQHIAELIFFFNPGLLWLSALLREERENCCDDIAVAAIENKTQLVHALVSFEEYRFEKASLALGFGQKKQHLLDRAKRLLQNSNHSLGRFEKTLLTVGFLAIGIVLMACSGRDRSVVDIAESANESAQVAANNAQMRIDSEQDYIDRTNVDTQRQIKDTEMQARDTEIQARDTEMTAREDHAHANEAAEEAKRMIAEGKKRQADAIAANNQAAYFSPVVLYPSSGCAPANQITRTVTTKTESAQTYEQYETAYDPSRRAYNKKGYKSGVSGEKLPDNLNVDHLTTNIISDLIAERVIKSTKNLSFKLSHMNLIVNGVEQPMAIHNKLRVKYVQPKFSSICYNFDFSTENKECIK